MNGASQTTVFDVSDTGASLMYQHVSLAHNNASEEVDYIAPFAATSSYDLGADVIPWVASNAAYDAATRTMRWTESGTGAATFTVLTVGFSQASLFRWNLVAPWTAGSLRLPPLPPSFSAFAIAPTATTFAIQHQLIKVPAGAWDVVRPLALTDPDFSQLAAQAPGAVSAVVTYSWPPMVTIARHRRQAAAALRR